MRLQGSGGPPRANTRADAGPPLRVARDSDLRLVATRVSWLGSGMDICDPKLLPVFSKSLGLRPNALSASGCRPGCRSCKTARCRAGAARQDRQARRGRSQARARSNASRLASAARSYSASCPGLGARRAVSAHAGPRLARRSETGLALRQARAAGIQRAAESRRPQQSFAYLIDRPDLDRIRGFEQKRFQRVVRQPSLRFERFGVARERVDHGCAKQPEIVGRGYGQSLGAT